MAWAATADSRAHDVADEAARARAVADRSGRWIVAGMVGLTLTALVPLWVATPLPLQDLPNHLLKVDVLQRYLAGDAQAREVYELNLRPVPNLACYWVILALSPLTGLVGAARLFVSLCVVGLCVATFVLVRRVNPENTIVSLVAPGIVYTDFLSKGFLNFTLALPLYVAGLIALANPEPGGRRAGWLCVLATAIYFTHGFVFLALGGAAVALAVLMRLPRREAAVRLGCFLPGAVLFAVWLHGGVGGPSVDAAAAAVGGSPSVATWDALGWLLGAAYGSAAAASWLVALAALAVCTLLQLARDRATRRFPLSPRDALLALGLVLAVAYYATSGAAGPNVSVRFVPLAILTALGGLRGPRARGLRAGLAMLLVASTLGLHARNAAAYVRRSADVAEYLRGMGAMQPGASLLPIDLERQPAGSRVNLHAWAYYHIERGGWGPYAHAWRSQHPVAYRVRPWGPTEFAEGDWFPPETARRAAACYDYVLVWGGDDAQLTKLGEDFVPVYAGGRLHVWENRSGVRKRPPAAVPECLAGAS